MLCMDKLSHLIKQEVITGNWRAIKMDSQGPKISHLMFVDDLLLVGEAIERQMQCVMKTLQNFCSLTWQEVSEEKSSILFSIMLPEAWGISYFKFPNSKRLASLVKTLGFLLVVRR